MTIGTWNVRTLKVFNSTNSLENSTDVDVMSSVYVKHGEQLWRNNDI